MTTRPCLPVVRLRPLLLLQRLHRVVACATIRTRPPIRVDWVVCSNRNRVVVATTRTVVANSTTWTVHRNRTTVAAPTHRSSSNSTVMGMRRDLAHRTSIHSWRPLPLLQLLRPDKPSRPHHRPDSPVSIRLDCSIRLRTRLRRPLPRTTPIQRLLLHHRHHHRRRPLRLYRRYSSKPTVTNSSQHPPLQITDVCVCTTTIGERKQG
uniref:Putative secreted peptide n=1 Tax=Anopheles braziliensis TaxID=58242 RepID=A0A2M3ZMI7_9DIPT